MIEIDCFFTLNAPANGYIDQQCNRVWPFVGRGVVLGRRPW
jgi:hypothetical protein